MNLLKQNILLETIDTKDRKEYMFVHKLPCDPCVVSWQFLSFRLPFGPTTCPWLPGFNTYKISPGNLEKIILSVPAETWLSGCSPFV